ncbi:MAG: GNVR domain-containing protein, partial [Candidatus Latescibacteria bacterium]|nr:GNVR domain-containing protein [Candidatus Latescibacterota bacterium]
NILDHIYILVRWRRMILACFFVVSLVTAGISLILPETYRSHATVYPPQSAGGGMGLSAILQELPVNLMGLGDDAISPTEFVPVVESERVRLAVAERFDLATLYGASHRSELLDMIGDRLQVDLSREQFLTISYEADTPEMAATLTNAFVGELQKALEERNQNQTRVYLTYLTKRLKEAEDDMLKAEKHYSAFQKEHMAIDLEAQAKIQLENASGVIGSLVDLIVLRDIKAETMTADNPKLKELDLEIQTTTRALNSLLMGKLPGTESSDHPTEQLPAIFKPFRELPQLGLTALQLIRDVEIQNAIYQFVKQEYEKTRFEDEKGSNPVIVLDKAVPPDVRSYPRRTLMVAIAGGLSLILSSIIAIIFEAMRNLTPDNQSKLDAISADLKGQGKS